MLLEEVEPLVRAGVAVHLLHPRSKRPIGDDWSERPVATYEQLQDRFRDGMNVGARLGKWSKVDGLYLHVVDMDIRDAERTEEAHARLETLFKGVRIWRMPRVISGSGGESRHIYILTDRPFPSKKLAHSDDKFTDAAGKKHWFWEIELFGTGKQVAMPPSIHPDTGKAYRWEREFDPDLMTAVPTSLLERHVFGDPDNDEVGETEVIGLSYRDAEDLLKDLPVDYWCEDREGWRNVGMALHHEFDGSREAYDIWVAFSKQSRKFDAQVQRQQWRSFNSHVDRPFRMASLLAAAKDVRIMEALNEPDDESEDDEPDTQPRKSDPDLSILRQSPHPAPEFPTHIFGKFWEGIVTRWAENGSSPVDFPAAALLAAAGSVIGNSTWVSPRPGWSEPPILWCQAVGLPSTNKTPAFRPLIKVLDTIEARWAPQHTSRVQRWLGEKKIADQKRKQWEAIVASQVEAGKDPPDMPEGCMAPPEPQRRRAYVTDITLEKLIRVHAGNERGLLNFRDEMTAWYANLGRYSNGSDRPYWLEAYTGGPAKLDRVKDNIEIYVPHFSVGILGGVQPARLVEMLQSADDGLQARFLPFWPESAERPFNRGVEDDGAALEPFQALSELTMKKDGTGIRHPHIVPFSPEALDVFEEWVNSHTAKERYSHERLRGFFGKANGHVARIALVLEYLWWSRFDDEDPPEQVSAKAVKAAIEFRETYLVPMQRRIMGHGLETNEGRMAKAIASWIIENRVESFNLRQVRREAGIEGIHSRTDVERVEEAIGYLASLRWITEEGHKGKVGRPSSRYHVNARLWRLVDIDKLL